MPAVQAISKDVSVSQKKIGPMMDLVRNKPVDVAINILDLSASPWAKLLAKTVRSAVANAENNMLMDRENLRVVRISADLAKPLRRFKPHARGKVGKIRKRASRITVIVDGEAI